MPKASPPAATLALHGLSTSDVARQDGRSVSLISRILNGYQPWDDRFEASLLATTGDRDLTQQVKGMAQKSWLDRRADKRAQSNEVTA